MNERDKERLLHIRDAISDIESFLNGVTNEEQFLKNQTNKNKEHPNKTLRTIAILSIVFLFAGNSAYAKKKKPEKWIKVEQKQSNASGDTDEKPELVIQNGHTGPVNSVAFSPDGKLFASGGWDKTVRIWTKDGILVYILQGHTEEVNSVTFSQNGKLIASVSGDSIRLWSLKGKLIRTINRFLQSESNCPVSSLAFSPDSKTIVSACDVNKIILWSIEGNFIRSIETHVGWIHSLAISPKDKIIAVAGGSDKKIKLLSYDGKLINTLSGHSDYVNSVSFSPDGKVIASASRDRTIKLWSIDGKNIQTLMGHREAVIIVLFYQNGKSILSASMDSIIKIWSLEGKQKYNQESGHTSILKSITLNPNNKTFITAGYDGIINIFLNEGTLIRKLKGQADGINSISISPDGKTIASDGLGKKINLWSTQEKFFHNQNVHSFGVKKIVFAPDGKSFAIATFGRTVELWSIEGKLIFLLDGHHKSGVNTIAFSPEGKLIATAGGDMSDPSDNTIKIWTLDGKIKSTLTGHTYLVNSLTFSPDGKTIVSVSDDSTIKFWSLNGKLLNTLKEEYIIKEVVFSKDGQTIANASRDNKIRFWTSYGKLINTFAAHYRFINSIAFSPDGKTIASGSGDNTIKLWTVEGKLLQTLSGHSSSINSIVFSPDGKTIISGSSDATTRIWNVSTGKELAALIAFNDGTGLVYTPDGRFDYTSPVAKEYVSYRMGNKFLDLDDIHDEFYTPGLLKRVMSGEDEPEKQESLTERQKKVPGIEVLSPDPQKEIAEDKDSIDLFFRLKDTGGGISKSEVYVNGRKVTSDFKDLKDDLELSVPVISGENRIEIKAFNKKMGAVSETVYYRKKLPKDGKLPKMKLFVLSVGINQYSQNTLSYSVNDAVKVADTIEKKAKGLFSEVKITKLLDANATRKRILTEFTKIRDEEGPNDVVFLYFSGHGASVLKKDGSKRLFYFLPSDFPWKNMESEATARRFGVDAEEISKLIDSMDSHRVVLTLDACQSGDAQIAMLGRSVGGVEASREQLNRLANGTGRFILTSAAGNELARENKSIGHGLFTYVLLKALGADLPANQGDKPLTEADLNKDGYISIDEIGFYISQNFDPLTATMRGDIIQSPQPMVSLGRNSISARVVYFPLVSVK